MNKFIEEDIERILNVTNSQDHPTNNAYRIYHFFIKEQAVHFEKLLKEKNIFFEKDQEFAKGKMMYLFAILKTDDSKVTKLNYLAIGKYRKPLIVNKALRWGILLFGLFILVFAIISFFMNK